jgi:hypothetical protein
MVQESEKIQLSRISDFRRIADQETEETKISAKSRINKLKSTIYTVLSVSHKGLISRKGAKDMQRRKGEFIICAFAYPLRLCVK